MQITEVRVFPVREDKLKAYASIVLESCFIVNDLKIIQGKKGLFISMPSRRRKRGGYRDVAHPLNNETRSLIEDQVLAEYQRVLESTDEAPPEALEEEKVQVVPAPAPVDTSSVWGRPEEAVERAPAPAPAEPVAAAAELEDEDKSLKEVEELHLRDSFWSVS